MERAQQSIIVIGAGPAGLTFALSAVEHPAGPDVRVVEADEVVGGISRTVERDGWRFDIGGHRFFTKVTRVDDTWHRILADDDFLMRPRMSRIFYRGRFFNYPLRPMNALVNLGVIEAIRCLSSYAWVRVRPPRDQTTFEGWVAARFGWRLYRIFFKTYTEKVWGVPATEIQADWAAQRIKNLSLGRAVVNALFPRRHRGDVTSLIDEFKYPKLGPGMMWERCTELVRAAGGEVRLGSTVTRIDHADGRATAVHTTSRDGSTRIEPADHIVSSMPLNELATVMSPPPPDEVLTAARALRHRDFLTVALVVPKSAAFPDNWIYIHEPGVRVGRIQNFGSWSPYMVRDAKTCLGLEYFVDIDDDLWRRDDADLVRFATTELEQLGLVPPGSIDPLGYVVRMPKAYPVYDQHYVRHVDAVRQWLAANVANVHPIGRNGMHKYNNQDHSMLTAMLTSENILDHCDHDVWTVNVEAEYHEEHGGGTGRAAPTFS